MKIEKKTTDCMGRLLKERSRQPYREFLLLFFLLSDERRSRNYSKTNGNKPCQIAVISFQMRLFSLFSIKYFITTNSIYISYTIEPKIIFFENNYIEIILCAKYMLIFYDMKINFLGCLRQCSLETRIFTIHFNFVSLGKI